MTNLVFATNNSHKLLEARAKISSFNIVSLSEIGFHEDIEEYETTLEGNARIKAEYIYNKFGVDCFADDTGLEVEALNGAPGVYTSRYAGTNPTFIDNMNKLLSDMNGFENRKARFRTAIHLIINGEHHSFEGIVNGTITTELIGEQGFGYDPIFIPEGYSETFAQLPLSVKNTISHRGRALDKLCDFLKSR